MATILKTLSRQGRSVLGLYVRHRPSVLSARFISTSKKNKDVTSTTLEPMEKSSTYKNDVEKFADGDPNSEKNWISFGYDFVDRNTDRFAHNMTMFLTISVAIIWGGFVLAYQPDFRMADWAQCEAYLEIDRRRRAGLPLVDPDVIDPAKVELPSDEELGDMEIIV